MTDADRECVQRHVDVWLNDAKRCCRVDWKERET